MCDQYLNYRRQNPHWSEMVSHHCWLISASTNAPETCHVWRLSNRPLSSLCQSILLRLLRNTMYFNLAKLSLQNYPGPTNFPFSPLSSLFKRFLLSGLQLCECTLVQEEDEAVCVWTDTAASFWENTSTLPCELWENSTVVKRKTKKGKKEKSMCLYNQ